MLKAKPSPVEAIYQQQKANTLAKLKEQRALLQIELNEYSMGVFNQKAVGRELILLDMKEIRHEIKKLNGKIGYLENPGSGEITDEMIEVAREYPIEEVLPNEVFRNKTRCFNHDDDNPSVAIYNNRIHCFACNMGWDSIAVVMQVEGLEFKEAVKRLNNGG